MKEKRYNYQPEEKVATLRQHLVDKIPVSDIFEQHSLQPTFFYRWQKEFFKNGAVAFSIMHYVKLYVISSPTAAQKYDISSL